MNAFRSWNNTTTRKKNPGGSDWNSDQSMNSDKLLPPFVLTFRVLKLTKENRGWWESTSAPQGGSKPSQNRGVNKLNKPMDPLINKLTRPTTLQRNNPFRKHE